MSHVAKYARCSTTWARTTAVACGPQDRRSAYVIPRWLCGTTSRRINSTYICHTDHRFYFLRQLDTSTLWWIWISLRKWSGAVRVLSDFYGFLATSNADVFVDACTTFIRSQFPAINEAKKLYWRTKRAYPVESTGQFFHFWWCHTYRNV